MIMCGTALFLKCIEVDNDVFLVAVMDADFLAPTIELSRFSFSFFVVICCWNRLRPLISMFALVNVLCFSIANMQRHTRRHFVVKLTILDFLGCVPLRHLLSLL